MNEILIDVDGSPRGYVAWYNHSTNDSMIRTTRSLPKNIKFGVQRAEMIAIYYALKDNIELLVSGRISGKKKLYIDVRSDSRSTIEQLQGISRIRDKKLLVMFKRIMKLLIRNGLRIVFHYVQRSMNIAGVILDLQRRGFL